MHGFSSFKLDKTNTVEEGIACSDAVPLFASHFFRRPLFDLIDHAWIFFFQTRQDKHWKKAVPVRVTVSPFAQLIYFFRRPLLDLMDPARSFFFGQTRQDTQTHEHAAVDRATSSTTGQNLDLTRSLYHSRSFGPRSIQRLLRR